MILTKRYLKKYLENNWIMIPDNLKKELLDDYGHPVMDQEGRMVEFTEQDIDEQLRKRINEELLRMGSNKQI